MQIFLSNIECPECHGHNCVKYVGSFCGTLYGCGDCENTFKPESAPNNACGGWAKAWRNFMVLCGGGVFVVSPTANASPLGVLLWLQ